MVDHLDVTCSVYIFDCGTQVDCLMVKIIVDYIDQTRWKTNERRIIANATFIKFGYICLKEPKFLKKVSLY